MISSNDDSSRRVAYFYNRLIGKFHYGKEHPMKPKRIAMAHNLIVNYGLYRSLDVYLTREASLDEIRKFHNPDYIQYLSQFMSANKKSFLQDYCSANHDISDNMNEELKLIMKWSHQPKIQNVNTQFKIGDSFDNPSFMGLFSYCQLSAGASIDCAHTILTGQCDIAINWCGGLHHAKKKEANGFCYVNDIVLCILELLRVYVRILYVDIDCHHGDGVEEAFYLTNRVMTLSFHQYGDDFYPGTGSIDSTGLGIGRYYAVNVPMKPGISDQPYIEMFKQITSRVMQVYRPDCIVMQCGADSLSLDRLGGFNLSIKGHGECVKYMKTFGVPMIMLGGGGYTIENVARCWAYETGIAIGKQIDQSIPINDTYYELYAPDYQLHYPIKQNVDNRNTQQDLNQIVASVYQHLHEIENSPGIHFHDVPISFYPSMDIEEEIEFDEKQEMSLNQLEEQLGLGDDIDSSKQESSKKEISVLSNSNKLHSKEL